MEKNEQEKQNQYTKISSLLFLRNQDKMHKLKMKKQGKMIRRRKFLKQHIYNNTNIFQMLTTKINRKSAQNIIWQKNYKLKMAINILKEQNSSVKARLWNIQKENRKMDKQIQSWNLQKVFNCSKNKPYIDMMTVSKVFADQDYQIVSTKIDIVKYQIILQEKQDQIQRLLKKNKDFQKFISHLKHTASQAKCKFLSGIANQDVWQNQQEFKTFLQRKSQQLKNQVYFKNEHTDYIKKNIQIKKKVNNEHSQQYQIFNKQAGQFKAINQSEIDKIKQQMRRIKLQEKNSIKDFKKDVKKLKRNTISFECQIQEEMGEFIKKKIQLNIEIQKMLQLIQSQLGQSQQYKSQILPQIQKLRTNALPQDVQK